MGSKERRQLSQDMVDRIDALLGGHELQRSPETEHYDDVAPVIEDRPPRFDDERPHGGSYIYETSRRAMIPPGLRGQAILAQASFEQADARMRAAISTPGSAWARWQIVAGARRAGRTAARAMVAAVHAEWERRRADHRRTHGPVPAKRNVRRYGR